MGDQYDAWAAKLEFEPVGSRSKNRPPLWKRVAHRRRRKKLAEHHKRVIAAVASGRAPKGGPHPKRPPKPRTR